MTILSDAEMEQLELQHGNTKILSDEEMAALESSAKVPPVKHSVIDAFKEMGRSSLTKASKNITLGTVGLPSLGVDKAVQAISGDVDYINPVSQYIVDMMQTSENQQQRGQKAMEQGGMPAQIAGMAGQVAGMIPDMLMGGAASSGMKTAPVVAGQASAAIKAMLEKGLAVAQPMAAQAGLTRYEDSLEKGNDTLESIAAGLGGFGNMAMQGALPMGMAGKLGTRIGSGVAVNVPAGMVGRQLENITSPENMQHDVFDPKALAFDAILGGTMHGVMGQRPEAPTSSPKAETKSESNPMEEGADKLVYAERRLESAQTRLEELKSFYDKATSKEKRTKLLDAITKQQEYIKQENDTVTKLKVALNQTDEAKAKTEAKNELTDLHEQVSKAEEEMEILSSEYKQLSSKGAALSKADTARLEEINTKYNELADFVEFNIPKIFGEDVTPTTPKPEPVATKPEAVNDLPIAEEFVPGATRGEVNEQIISKNYDNYSNEVLANMINNKQEKIHRIGNALIKMGFSDPRSGDLLSLRDYIRQEQDHLQKILDGRSIDPKSTGSIGKVSPQLDAAVKAQDLRAGLQAIVDGTGINLFTKQVARALLRNEKIGKFIKLHYDAQSKYDAFTARGTGDITFRSSAEATPINFLHEAIHSATSGMLIAFKNGVKFDAKTTRAINQLISIHEALQGRYYNQFVSELSKFSKTAEFDISIILKNERELLAYALTDTAIRQVLNAIQWNGKSYMRRLVDSVADMMGWTKGKERSILEAITESGDVLFESSNGRGRDGQGGVDAIRQLTPSGDIGYNFSNKLVDNLTNLPNRAMLRLLNASAIKNFWKGHPFIQEAANKIELANRRMESTRSLILHGDVTLNQYKKGSFIQRMNKMEAPDGLLPSLSRVTFDKIGEMVPVLIKAARDGVSLHTDFARYNADTWSPEQKYLAKVLAGVSERMLKVANESLIARGLPPIKDWGPGYIPTHTSGKYHVDVYLNNEIIRREWFLTEQQAKAAQDVLSANKQVTTRIGERVKDADYDTIDAVLREALEVTGTHKNIDLHQWIEGKLQEIEVNRSGVGSHKQHKDLLRGFSGDKVGKTTEQQGKEFAHAIEQWVGEYTNAIRKREIQHDLAKLEATKPDWVQKYPNAHEVVRYMMSNELGELESPLQGKVSEAFNNFANDIAVSMGMKNLERDVLPYAYSLLTRGAYNMVLTSAPVTWLTQTLGFMNAQRMYFKYPDASPLHAAEAASRGLMKVLFKDYDPELMQAMHYVSQNFETLHKHLTNEISEFQWHEDKNHIRNKLYRFISGETFTTNGDAVSRTIAFAQAVEFLKLQGKSGESMWIEAARMTDDNMNAFGRKNLAGLYKELGAAGTILAPLKSFIHHQAGNLAIDVKDVIQQPSVNNALALTANMLGMMLMGGLLSTPFLADYEYLRGLLVKAGVIAEDALPNWTQIAETLDPVYSRGVLSTTGIDMGASMRFQSVFKPFGDIVGANSMVDAALPLSVATKFTTGMATLGKGIVGNVPEDEMRQALKGVVPRGIPAGAVDTLDTILSDSNTNVTVGKRGQKLIDKEMDERVAKWIGSRTIDEAHEQTKNQQLDQHRKLIVARKQKAVDLFLSESKGNKEKGREIALELIRKGEWTQQEFIQAAKNLQMSQLRPVNESAVISNSGTVSKQNLRNYNFLQRMERQ